MRKSETGDIDRTTFRLNGQYPIMRQFSLLGSVGYETIDTNSLNDDPDGALWYVGFFTRPGPKTELRLTYGERYGEPDINGSLTYRITPRLTFQSSYTHVLETTQRQFSSFQLAAGRAEPAGRSDHQPAGRYHRSGLRPADGSLYGQPVPVVAGRQLRAQHRDAGGFPRGAGVRHPPQ